MAKGWMSAAFVLLLASCGGAPATSPGASPSGAGAAQASASAATPARLKLIYSANTIDQMPAFAAQDAGYFKKNGLEVDMEYLAGGTKTIQAMLAGQAQVSLQGGNEAMSAVAGGAELVLIGGLLPVYAFKLEAQKGINSVDDLKGKKLGVSTIGGTADVALRTFLRKHGIDPDKDLSIIATGDSQTTSAAIKAGAVDASLSVPPNLLQAEAAGTHPIADLAGEHLPNAQYSVTVQRGWLSANRATAQKLTDSLTEGLARIKKDKPFTEDLMRKYLKYDDQKGLDYTYDFFTSEVWPDYPHIKAEQLGDGVTELSKTNEKLKGFNPSSMIDDSLVQDAEKRDVAKQA